MGRIKEEQELSAFDDMLEMPLNSELQFAHGRYIKAPGGWIFESDRGGVCFIPHSPRI